MEKIDLENIHSGTLISQHFSASMMEISRICNFMKCNEKDISEIYRAKSVDTEILLKWSKLLAYDFFKIYTQYLILYAPQGNRNCNKIKETSSKLPQFRKNIYTKEVIDFILESIQTGEKTKSQIIVEYRIPKATLYKWIHKYTVENEDK